MQSEIYQKDYVLQHIHLCFLHVSLLTCLNQDDVCKLHRFRGTKETMATPVPAGSSIEHISLSSEGECGPSEEGRVGSAS